MAKVNSVVDTILGEAAYGTRQQRYRDMVNIASVIANRAAQTGVSPDRIVSVRSEFNAYGKPLPAGASAYRSLAQQAWEHVQKSGPVHKGTFYATPKAAKNLPSGLKQVASTSGHVYFSDPMNRAIRTASGFVKPAATMAQKAVQAVASVPSNISAAMRTAAFEPYSRPKADVPNLPTGYDLPSRAMSPVAYSMGPRRPNPPSQGLVSRIQTAATDVLGPGVGVRVTSGQGQYGSTRHRDPHGIAADVQLVDLATGKNIRDPQAMMDVAQAFAAQGGKGVGYGPEYMGFDTMHLDTAAPGPGQDNEWGSIGNRNAGLLADARNSALMPASFYERNLPKTMDVPPSRNPEALVAAPLGKVERSPLPDAAPRAPDPARFAYDTQPNPERFGPRAPTTTARVDRLPSTNIPEPNAARFAYDVNPAPSPERFGYGIVSPAAAAPVTPATPQEPITTPKTSRLPASPVDPVKQASIYSQYAASRMAAPTPPPGVSNMLTSSVPVGPAQTLGPQPPQPTFVPSVPNMPVQAQPMPVQQRIDQAFNTASFPAAPPTPQFTAADVYAGRASVGQATGGNTVSRDQFGNTSVTNKYGVTTTTGPNGNQMASSGPGIGGPLGGNIGSIFEARPDLNGRSQFGNTARGVGGSMAGSAIGSLGGPVGSIIGALIGGELAKPGGGRIGDFFNGVKTFDVLGQPMKFARPQAGGPFPTAPRGPAGALGGRESNLTDRQMRDISPRAADAISKGVGGLY